MIWNVKKTKENEKEILIAYSHSESLDGVISYDKEKEFFEIKIQATDCDEYDSRRIFQFLYGMIMKNILSFDSYSIVIG